MPASYSYIISDCVSSEECLIDRFDKDLDGMGADCSAAPCVEKCLECARNAIPKCDACTCAAYDFQLAAEVNHVPPGDDPGTFEFCDCLYLGDHVNSLPDTAVITGGFLTWDESGVPSDQTFAAIGALTCPEAPDVTMQIWVGGPSAAPCTPMPTVPNWSPGSIFTNPVCASRDDLSFYFSCGPVVTEVTDPRFDCSAQHVPPYVFAVWTNGCGVIMAACPIVFGAHDTILCPTEPPPDCCTPFMDDGYSEGCGEDGHATIHLALSVVCGDNCIPCEGGVGTINWSTGASGAPLANFTIDGASYTFSVPCGESDFVTLDITFACDPPCATCPSVSVTFYINIAP